MELDVLIRSTLPQVLEGVVADFKRDVVGFAAEEHLWAALHAGYYVVTFLAHERGVLGLTSGSTWLGIQEALAIVRARLDDHGLQNVEMQYGEEGIRLMLPYKHHDLIPAGTTLVPILYGRPGDLVRPLEDSQHLLPADRVPWGIEHCLVAGHFASVLALEDKVGSLQTAQVWAALKHSLAQGVPGCAIMERDGLVLVHGKDNPRALRLAQCFQAAEVRLGCAPWFRFKIRRAQVTLEVRPELLKATFVRDLGHPCDYLDALLQCWDYAGSSGLPCCVPPLLTSAPVSRDDWEALATQMCDAVLTHFHFALEWCLDVLRSLDVTEEITRAIKAGSQGFVVLSAPHLQLLPPTSSPMGSIIGPADFIGRVDRIVRQSKAGHYFGDGSFDWILESGTLSVCLTLKYLLRLGFHLYGRHVAKRLPRTAPPGFLWALMVSLCDDYIVMTVGGDDETRRFLKLGATLPLDLQMVLCNRAWGAAADTISPSTFELGVRLVVLVLNC